jgi:hypothetical protein
MLTLEDFSIDVLSFELRYDNAYLLWDRAGALASRILEHEPRFRFLTAQPNSQTFETDDVKLTVELGLLRVFSRGSSAHQKLTSTAQAITDAATEILNLTSFSRAGYRSIYKRTFPDKAAAIKTLSPLAPTADSSLEGFKRTSFVSTNRMEDASRGMLATAKVEEQEINVTIPWEATKYVESMRRKNWVNILDCDYYTLGSTDRDAFNTETWLKYADKSIRQYWEKMPL